MIGIAGRRASRAPIRDMPWVRRVVNPRAGPRQLSGYLKQKTKRRLNKWKRKFWVLDAVSLIISYYKKQEDASNEFNVVRRKGSGGGGAAAASPAAATFAVARTT